MTSSMKFRDPPEKRKGAEGADVISGDSAEQRIETSPNPETSIKYSAPKDGNIQIEVYNILGKKVRTLFDGQQAAGTYEVRWNARDDYGSTLSSGVYLITLRSGNFVTAKRITLLK